MNNEEDAANPLIINRQDKEDQCTSAIEVEERSINIEESDLMRSEAMRWIQKAEKFSECAGNDSSATTSRPGKNIEKVQGIHRRNRN